MFIISVGKKVMTSIGGGTTYMKYYNGGFWTNSNEYKPIQE